MSDKIEISQVAEIIKRHKIEPATLRDIVEEMNALIQEKDEGEESVPRAKQAFNIVISDPSGKVPQGLVGWVVQIPENASPASIMDRVFGAAHEFNASKKGRLLPVKSVGEAFESVSRKFFKEKELHTKTRTPVAVIVTDNKLSEPPSV